ncbi:hypothetical protein HD554DRAFT_2039322 [Boletus coccyginus]|nr:hypothetical protein HD554DRAFT_2039322 [Boletus coccyginus]
MEGKDQQQHWQYSRWRHDWNYSLLFEVVGGGVKNHQQALAGGQAEEQEQKVIIEEQAGEQEKKVMVEEAGVEWEVEMENASDAFAEHEDVQCTGGWFCKFHWFFIKNEMFTKP